MREILRNCDHREGVESNLVGDKKVPTRNSTVFSGFVATANTFSKLFETISTVCLRRRTKQNGHTPVKLGS